MVQKSNLAHIESGSESPELGLLYLRNLMTQSIGGEPPIEKMRKFLGAIGGPKIKPRIVQVIGTNGKGSVVAQVSSLLISAGFSVGSTISPHLSKMNERCRINGKSISDKLLNHYALEVKKINQNLDIEMPFPVAMLAVSTLFFIEEDVDFIVLETGLGGRLDGATAFESPEVIAITTIGRDHEHILGSYPFDLSLEKVAAVRDKAAVVLGRIEDEVREFLVKGIEKRDSKATSFGVDFDYKHSSEFKYLSGQELDFSLSSEKWIKAPLNLEGSHQADNLAVSLEVVSKLGIDISKLDSTNNSFSWYGRLERFYSNSREWILDCAHNEDGIFAISNHLKNLSDQKYIVCFSGVGDKNWTSIVESLRPITDKLILIELDNPRAANMHELQSHLSSIEISSEIHPGSYRDLIEKISSGDNNCSVLVIGSLYLVGSLRKELINK